nr:MAG TPA: hypothetical protein [Caudoviricetes sp.]
MFSGLFLICLPKQYKVDRLITQALSVLKL